ncbi:MAG: putative tetR family transcriptional regulatory protein [Aeromicrobium sp.]|nr:putative tetR family transcriptional regulatory protein [Aeromicrobium sp.]
MTPNPGARPEAKPRPKRVDARQNRDRIIQAAYEVLAELGVDAQMTDIAERAELGVATLYRNFPSKEALVNALVLERLSTGASGAQRVSEIDDAWEALTKMLEWIARRQLENRVVSQFLGGRITGSAELHEQRDRLYASVEEVVKKAQRAGQMRKDVRVSDIRMIMVSIAAIASTDSPLTNRLVQRYLAVVLDGLRAPGHTKLAGPPLTIAESEEVINPPARAGKTPSAMRRGRSGWPT